MSYSLLFEPRVYEELGIALAHHRQWNEDASLADYLAVVQAKFKFALQHPEALPRRRLRNSPVPYRQVTIWHFVYLYRIDTSQRVLIVEKVIHERSREVQDELEQP